MHFCSTIALTSFQEQDTSGRAINSLLGTIHVRSVPASLQECDVKEETAFCPGTAIHHNIKALHPPARASFVHDANTKLVYPHPSKAAKGDDQQKKKAEISNVGTFYSKM